MIDRLQTYTLFQEQQIKSFELLTNQGNCNENYLLTTEQQKYLIRKFKLSNDRKSEFKIQKAIAKKNIGATPLLLDEIKGVMVCDFIEGKHRPKLDKISLRRLALLIKKLHKTKIRQKPTNLKKSFTFKDKKVHLCFIELQKQKKEFVLCHNDLHSQNILFGKSIKLIDWEYAGINDRYFDLASIITEHKLNKIDEAYLLHTYFGREQRVNYQKLTAFKVIYKALWRLWFEKLDRGEL